MKRTVKIGTRGSKLALYQANRVKAELSAAFPNDTFELEIINTKGDKILDVALSKIGDKGLFTKELESELLSGQIDLAVHSLKDLPTVMDEKLVLGGVLKRGEFRDALVSNTGKKIADLTENDVIATSSLRRKAQLLNINPNFKIIDIRGNVDTRIQKMKDGYCSVMVMAAAGLQRLNFDEYISEILDAELFIPAVGQGAIALQIRKNDIEIQELLGKITDSTTLLATNAERVFLNKLEGGCQIPLGAYTEIIGDRFKITGFVSDCDGNSMIKESMTGSTAYSDEIAANLANLFLAEGAHEIIEKIRNSLI